MTQPTRDELERAFAELERIHRTHLVPHGVRLPAPGSARAFQLAVLWHWRDRPVHKNEISEIVRRELPDAAPDQQVRHLKRDGWNITGRGSHQLADPYRPSPEFANEQARRRGRLDASTFDELKAAFGNRCATCGAVEGEPDPRYGGGTTVLDQGHQDPAKPADDPANIIPQCANCNRQYKDDFVFDDKGRAYAVHGINPVRRASKAVQRRILDYLRETLEGET